MKNFTFFAIALVAILPLCAQESIGGSGGDAAGAGGSSSYTYGQVFYTTNTGATGSVAQGVQHNFCLDPDVPTVSATPSSGCPGSLVTLSIVSGNLNNATNWEWYSESCGGTPVGSGSSINVFPAVNTIYFARGEGDCVTPGTCDSVAVTAIDNTPPVISCPENQTVNNDVGQCNAFVTISAPVVSDNCPGTALNFDGSNEYVDPNTILTISDNFTIEMWVNPTATHEIDTQSTSGTSGTNGQRFALWTTHGNTYGGGPAAGAGISVGTNGISVYEHAAGYLPALLVYAAPVNGWTHISVVYTNKQPRLYVNGLLVKTGLTSTRTVYPSTGNESFGNFQYGGFGGGYYGNYIGDMDEVRIWDFSRTQAQIQTDYTSMLSGSEPGLILNYNFEDGAGSPIATDTSTSGFTGTLENMDPNTDWIQPGRPNLFYTNDYNNTVDASDTYPVGTTNVVWTVTDNAGNTDSCTQVITVNDMEAPEITCAANVIVDNDPGLCSAEIELTPPTVSDNCSSTGNALNFDGVDDYVVTQPMTIANTGITVEAWINPTTFSLFDRIAEQDFASAWYFGSVSGSNDLSVWFNNTEVAVTSGSQITLGSWQHVAFVYDLNTIKIYINGVEKTSAVYSGSVSSNLPLYIGEVPNFIFEDRDFNGSMDEVRIWNIARTQAEIQANMNSELNAQANLVASYHFNEGVANGNNAGIITATDTSGNGNDGTLNNFALNSTTSNWVEGNVSSGPTLSNDAPGTFAVGDTTITWTATDAAGNMSTCEQIVTVEDNENPVITCIADDTRNTDPGLCQYTVVGTEFDATFTDNCTHGSISNDLNETATIAGAILPKGNTTVIWTVDDGNGQTETCTTVITVEDNENPVLAGVPADATVQCDAIPAPASPTASDNCDNDISIIYDEVINNYDCNYSYTITRTWIAMDDFGNTDTEIQVIMVEDTTDPVLAGVPADVTVECDAVPPPASPTASDNCHSPEEVTITFTEIRDDGINANNYTLTRTWTAVDSCGNSATGIQVIAVVDTSDPTINCPADITVNIDPGVCGAVVTYTPPVGSDSCGISTTILIAGLGSGATFPVGLTTETYEVTDADGNTATCSFNVTVNDTEDPVITCPADILVSNDNGLCSAVVTYTAPVGTDNCTGSTTVQTAGLASGSAFPVGTTTNTFEVTDASGNTETCSFDVTVNDTEDPVITCPADITVSNDLGLCSAEVTYTAPVGTDNCTGSTTVQTAGLASGSDFPVGITTNTFEVTDADGNTAICSFDVTVNDTEDPVIYCSVDITVSNDPGLCSAEVTYTVSASDNCPGETIVQTAGLTSGSAFPVGTTTNTFEITDASGNTETCSFDVTVNDTEDPTITCLLDIAINNEAGQCGVVVTYPTPMGTDNCTGESTVQTTGLSSGSNFPVGTTTNTFVVTDDAGNTATCSFNITVFDNEAPVITCPADIIVDNDNGLCSAVVTYTAPVGTDNCTGSTTVQTAGLASGSAFPVGTTTNTFEVTDASGIKATCSFDITVFDNEAPTALCQDISVDLDATGNASITADDVDDGSSDPCGIDTIVLSQYAFDCSNEGENTVILTVTDIYGNTASCTATVTVNGIIPEVEIAQSELPDFCQGEYILLTATSNQQVTYSWNGGETTDVIEVSTNGTYGVTVTSTTGCTDYEEYEVVGFDAEATFSSYTLLATEEIKLEDDNNVLSGGVGVLDSDGKVKLKDNSHVTGFVRASEIDIDNSSSAGSSTLSPANVVLPQFFYNTLSDNSSPDITVPDNQAMTLYGDVYGKIDIKEGATVTFAQSNVYIDELKTKKNTTIEFSGCSFLYINKELKFDENATLNALGNKVVIYVDHEIEVKKGGSITASMYANDDDIKIDGKDSDPTYMKGMFIAKKIDGDDYVNWEWDTNCTTCPTAPQGGEAPLLGDDPLFDFGASLIIYPNPAKGHVILNNPNNLNLDNMAIYDLRGRLIKTIELKDMGTEKSIDIAQLESAVYLLVIKGEDGQLVKQLIKE